MWIDEIEWQKLVAVYGELKPINGFSIGKLLDPNITQCQLISGILTDMKDQEISAQFLMSDSQKLYVCMLPLLCDQYRVPESWSINIPVDISYQEIKSILNSYFQESFSEQPYRLKFKEFSMVENKLCLILQADDIETSHTLDALRDFALKILGLHMFRCRHFEIRIHLGVWYSESFNDLEAEINEFISDLSEEFESSFGVLKLDSAKVLEHSSLLNVKEIITSRVDSDR